MVKPKFNLNNYLLFFCLNLYLHEAAMCGYAAGFMHARLFGWRDRLGWAGGLIALSPMRMLVQSVNTH